MTNRFKVVYTDNGFESIETEKNIIESAGAELTVAQCRSADEVIKTAREADGLLVQWAPITEEVIKTLDSCTIIVRLGIGVDNVDIKAARARGIAVCNVPDYCVDEVADHTMAMALGLARRIPAMDRMVRDGKWSIIPDGPVHRFNEMNFAALGFGRIARGVLERAKAFGFRLMAHDPFISADSMKEAGVTPMELDQLFKEADIISLHCQLNESTRHIVNSHRLGQMKSKAIIINTARGPLIDIIALADALQNNQIGGAGLDVFEKEPLQADHPILSSPNVVLTSHNAWYSEKSVPELQRKAAEEIVRGLRGEALMNQIA